MERKFLDKNFLLLALIAALMTISMTIEFNDIKEHEGMFDYRKGVYHDN